MLNKILRIIGWELFILIFAISSILLKINIEDILLPHMWVLVTFWSIVMVGIAVGMWFEKI